LFAKVVYFIGMAKKSTMFSSRGGGIPDRRRSTVGRSVVIPDDEGLLCRSVVIPDDEGFICDE